MHRSRWLRNQTKNYVPELCAAIIIGHNPERYGFKIEQLPPYAYETVEVDKMTSLAVLARYAGSDVDSLKELNPELLRASTPPGHYSLRVPPGLSGATARALARIPAGQRLDFQTYKIRKGDTLAKVAAKFHLNTEDLLEANDLQKAQFKAGRVIKVPPPPPSPIDNRDLLPPVERAKVIEDHPLETLPAIPSADGVRPLKDLEPQPSSADLPTVPATVTVPAAVAVPRVAPRPVLDTHPKFHTVKKGETLFAISVRYGLDLNKLRKWNKIKGNRIQNGQRLRLTP
jgi:membrane-bound lytic murein transglycosylase D